MIRKIRMMQPILFFVTAKIIGFLLDRSASVTMKSIPALSLK
jgi:hypothetical protein